MKNVIWTGKVPGKDDFGDAITGSFIDGKTKMGPWAIMTPSNHRINGVGLGVGLGQKYVKVLCKENKSDPDRWVKTQG